MPLRTAIVTRAVPAGAALVSREMRVAFVHASVALGLCFAGRQWPLTRRPRWRRSTVTVTVAASDSAKVAVGACRRVRLSFEGVTFSDDTTGAVVSGGRPPVVSCAAATPGTARPSAQHAARIGVRANVTGHGTLPTCPRR